MIYPKDFINKIICGDCLKVMKDIPNESMDLIFTDLPFNYQGGKTIGKNKKERYLYQINQIIKETVRVLKNGGNYIVINNPTNLYRTAKLYNENGLLFRNGVPLIRPAMFRPAYHLGFKHNYLWFLAKGNKKTWYGSNINHSDEHLPDVWEDIRYQNGFRMGKIFHPQAIKENLTERIIKLTTKKDDIILDSFMGSGTTAIVCKKLNRNFIGIEINKKYYEMANARIEAYNKGVK